LSDILLKSKKQRRTGFIKASQQRVVVWGVL